jgi:hypothetical protein
MAPIKFEEQLKEKLEQRSIQPSSDAWNKLSERLDKVEEKQNNKGFWWLGIAATLVGVLVTLTFIFKTNTEIIEPTIVDTKKETIIEKQDLQNLEVLGNNAVAIEENDKKSDEAQQNDTKTLIIKMPLKAVIIEQQDALIPNIVNETLAEVDTEFNEVNNKTIETKHEIVSFETLKVNEVVAQIQKLQQENKEVTTEEIDALLATAQKEITMQKLFNEATKTVDADALLRSVEDDLELTFRDKVFSAIKSGYETVKTAVVERNN